MYAQSRTNMKFIDITLPRLFIHTSSPLYQQAQNHSQPCLCPVCPISLSSLWLANSADLLSHWAPDQHEKTLIEQDKTTKIRHCLQRWFYGRVVLLYIQWNACILHHFITMNCDVTSWRETHFGVLPSPKLLSNLVPFLHAQCSHRLNKNEKNSIEKSSWETLLLYVKYDSMEQWWPSWAVALIVV